MLNLTKDDGAVAVLHFIEDGDSERCLSVSDLNIDVIKDLEEGGTVVPAASFVLNGFGDVGAGEAGDRHPEEIVGSVAAFGKERRQALLNLVESSFLP